MTVTRSLLTPIVLLAAALTSPATFAQAPTGVITNRVVAATNAVWDVRLMSDLHTLNIQGYWGSNGLNAAVEAPCQLNGRGQLRANETNTVALSYLQVDNSGFFASWADVLDVDPFPAGYVAHGSISGHKGAAYIYFTGQLTGVAPESGPADTNVLVLSGFGTNFITAAFTNTITTETNLDDTGTNYVTTEVTNQVVLAGDAIDATDANGTYYWNSDQQAYTNLSNGYGIFLDPVLGITWLTNSLYHDLPDTNFSSGMVVSAVRPTGPDPFAPGGWYEGSNNGADTYPGARSSYPAGGPSRRFRAYKAYSLYLDSASQSFRGSDGNVLMLAGVPHYVAASPQSGSLTNDLGDGTWTLVLKFDPPQANAPKRLQGTATVTLSTGTVFPFRMMGSYNSAQNLSHILLLGVLGEDGQGDARGASLSLTLNSQGQIMRLLGRVAGQYLSQK